MKLILLGLLYLLLSCFTCHAQEKQKVVVLDSLTKEPIQFATIMFTEKDSLTYTNATGLFFRPTKLNTLVSCIGYNSKGLSSNLTYDTIFLEPKIYELQEVAINFNKKQKEHYIGYSNEKNEFALCYPSGGEVAVLIPNNESLNLRIVSVIVRFFDHNYARKSNNIDFNSIFKIKLYEVCDRSEVGNLLYSKTFTYSSKTFHERAIFDLSDLFLIMPGNGIFVSIEWIGKENPINFPNTKNGNQE